MKAFLPLVLLGFVAATARADIFAWKDDQGIRHFTNVLEDVPAEFRGDARIVARERGTTAPDTPEDTTPRQAQVVYDPTRLRQVYAEGVADGRREGERNARRERPPTLQVVSPITIANVPIIPTYPPYIAPECLEPFGTVGFDHGRLRHRTWRLGFEECTPSLAFNPFVGTFGPVGPVVRPLAPGRSGFPRARLR